MCIYIDRSVRGPYRFGVVRAYAPQALLPVPGPRRLESGWPGLGGCRMRGGNPHSGSEGLAGVSRYLLQAHVDK